MRTCACSYCRRTSVPLRGNLVFFGFCSESCERQLHDARDQRIMRSSRQKTHMNRGGVCPELAMRLRRIASPTWPLCGQSQRTRAKTGCISGRTHAIDPGKVTSDGDNYRAWAGGWVVQDTSSFYFNAASRGGISHFAQPLCAGAPDLVHHDLGFYGKKGSSGNQRESATLPGIPAARGTVPLFPQREFWALCGR